MQSVAPMIDSRWFHLAPLKPRSHLLASNHALQYEPRCHRRLRNSRKCQHMVYRVLGEMGHSQVIKDDNLKCDRWPPLPPPMSFVDGITAGCLASHSNLRGSITPTPRHQGVNECEAKPNPAEFISIKPWAAMGSGAPGSCAGHSRVASPYPGFPSSTTAAGL